MLPDPIVIVGTLRCGSSLTANIFARHGVWTGECIPADRRNRGGYFENVAVKRAVRERIDDPQRVLSQEVGPQNWFRPFMEKTLASEGYAGGPWLVKHSALYWRLWDDFAPKWVLPRRDLGEVFRSLRKADFASYATDAELKDALKRIDRMVEHLRDDHGGVEIDMARLVGGDRGQMIEALKHCGIDPDPEIVARVVRPEHWHGRC